MFISTRFLQMGALALALAGCASSGGTTAALNAPPTPSASPAAQKKAAQPPAQQPAAQSEDVPEPAVSERDIKRYAATLAAERGLDPARVQALLNSARYNATVARLIAPPAAMPDGAKPQRSWPAYRQRFVEPIRIRAGVAFMAENAQALARAESRYGVPADIIAAIIGVETLYGKHMGNFRVLDALATLAFDYPDPKRPDRAEMFRTQLGDLIELSAKDGVDAASVRGSYAGAIGLPQFMPGSILHYAVDGNGDGKIDLINDVDDAIQSVANFLVEHGWQRGLPVFAPVRLPADPSGLVDGGLSPHLDWAGMQAAGAVQLGATPAEGAAIAAWQRAGLGVINLPDEPTDTVQYRTGTPNFFALTHYNRSYFYATSVSDLADALRDARLRRQAEAPR